MSQAQRSDEKDVEDNVFHIYVSGGVFKKTKQQLIFRSSPKALSLYLSARHCSETPSHKSQLTNTFCLVVSGVENRGREPRILNLYSDTFLMGTKPLRLNRRRL